jgi:carbon storage regulator
MLVLSRQRDESIIIGDNVQITIVDIRGDKVRLGIEAPAEVTVHRKEVFDAIQRENRRAAGVTAEDVASFPPPKRGPRPRGNHRTEHDPK